MVDVKADELNYETTICLMGICRTNPTGQLLGPNSSIVELLLLIYYLWRCPWCNGYRRRNWTRRHEFESWTECISHCTNTFGKGMNPIILLPARDMGK